ncbi:MAG: AarF/ABC1/UbiB kinase family protein [Nitrospirota bacterium]
MKMFTKWKRTIHYDRYREIAAILARHGLGWLAIQLNLGGLIPFHWGLLGHPRRKEPYTQAEHMRMALEDLGTTFIKLGQILSTRPDLIPPEYVGQFSKLQDSAPPLPYSRVIKVIQQELGPPEKIFKTFNVQPLASASIGQVHEAFLHDDTTVVVKVQRPGVEALVERDLEVLTDLARLAEEHTRVGAYYDITGWVNEFAFILRNEMDYTREAHNADRIRTNFVDDERLYVPRINWEYTTKRVLTMEKISGIKINDIKALDKAGLDRHRIAENCAHIVLTMAYEHGFFHADPHPGNFIVLSNEVIGLIDYGMVGRLDENLRRSLLRLDMALIRRDADRLVDELMALGIARGTVQRNVLKRDLDHMIHRFYDLTLKEGMATQAFNELVTIALRHRLQLPSDLIILFKVIAMSEGIGAQLDPDFKLTEFADPYFRRFWLQSYSLRKQVRRIAEGTQDLTDLSLDLPKHARRLLGQLERGEITFIYRFEGLQESLREFQRAANRVSMSVLAAALVIGLGLLMLIYHPPGWREYGGWFFALLFVLVIIFNLGLLWKIWRSGRMR